MDVNYLADSVRFAGMNTEEVRGGFLVSDLFSVGEVVLHYFDVDRVVVGSAVAAGEGLELVGGKALAAEYFCERRELGVFHVGGGDGAVEVDGQSYALAARDCLYVGRGSRSVRFSSVEAGRPARFYLVSYPAHAAYPVRLIRESETELVELGGQEKANRRRLRKYIRPGAVESCQLVMGRTEMVEGNVWNTMPTHTHERRMEVYLYTDVAEGEVVFHFMGRPTETRHIVVRDGEAVVSPSWSIHSGAGTRAYSFIWAMGGENQAFDDMDAVGMEEIA